MTQLRTERYRIEASEDIVRVRQRVREHAVQVGLSLVDQTKIVTAASELARNTLEYGLGGYVDVQEMRDFGKRGLRLTFVDDGPGISDIELALTDGYTSGKGLGLGLSGARRLSNEFQIDSEVGRGTRITIARWK